MNEPTKIIEEMFEEKKCLIMRNGIRIWLREGEAQKFFGVLEKLNGSTFVKINDVVINTADVIGIFGQQEIQDLALSKGKDGTWKCQYNYEHWKGDYCKCRSKLKDILLIAGAKGCDKGCNEGKIIVEEKDWQGNIIMVTKRCECAEKVVQEYNKVLLAKSS